MIQSTIITNSFGIGLRAYPHVYFRQPDPPRSSVAATPQLPFTHHPSTNHLPHAAAPSPASEPHLAFSKSAAIDEPAFSAPQSGTQLAAPAKPAKAPAKFAAESPPAEPESDYFSEMGMAPALAAFQTQEVRAPRGKKAQAPAQLAKPQSVGGERLWAAGKDANEREAPGRSSRFDMIDDGDASLELHGELLDLDVQLNVDDPFAPPAHTTTVASLSGLDDADSRANGNAKKDKRERKKKASLGVVALS